jgi:nucleotide-binding universal stress UspA family protein
VLRVFSGPGYPIETIFSRAAPIISWEFSTVWGKILLGVGRLDKDRSVVQQAVLLAAEAGSAVHVVHVRERCRTRGGPCYLESMHDAARVVEEAVFELRMAGVGASGEVENAERGAIPLAILDEAARSGADVIMVGWHRRRGIGRLFRHKVCTRLARLSRVPLIFVPDSAAARNAPGQAGLDLRSQPA